MVLVTASNTNLRVAPHPVGLGDNSVVHERVNARREMTREVPDAADNRERTR